MFTCDEMKTKERKRWVCWAVKKQNIFAKFAFIVQIFT